MRVVDTSVWVEFVSRGPLAQIANGYIAQPADIFVPVMVLMEARKWALREQGVQGAERLVARLGASPLLLMDRDVALLAAELCGQHRLATADAVIFAHAQIMGVELVTFDHAFAHVPGVVFHDKRPPARPVAP